MCSIKGSTSLSLLSSLLWFSSSSMKTLTAFKSMNEGSVTAQKAIGAGIPTLPRKLVEKILQWEYVDFNDLPPALGTTKHFPLVPSNVLLVQSAETVGSQRKLIPDLTTWMQCFSIYVSVLSIQHAQFVPELLSRDPFVHAHRVMMRW